MRSAFSLYFRLLFSSFIVVCFFSLFILFFLLVFHYSLTDSMIIFRDLLIFTIPWFLWYHTILLFVFFTHKNIFSYLIKNIGSLFITGTLLILLFPSIPTVPHFYIQDIQSQLLPIQSPIYTEYGTIVLEPQLSAPTSFAQEGNKALLISSNLFLFNSVETNAQTLTFSQAQHFNQEGYFAQTGSLIIPQEKAQEIFTIPPLATTMVEKWLDINFQFNKSISQIYPINNSSSQVTEYKALKLAEKLPTVLQTLPHSFQDLIQQETNDSEIAPEIKGLSEYLDLLVIFLYIFSFAGVLGSFTSISRHPVLVWIMTLLVSTIFALFPFWAFPYISKLSVPISLSHKLWILIIIFNSLSYALCRIKKTKEHHHS